MLTGYYCSYVLALSSLLASKINSNGQLPDNTDQINTKVSSNGSESHFDSNPHTLHHVSESELLALPLVYLNTTCQCLEHLPSIKVPDQTKVPDLNHQAHKYLLLGINIKEIQEKPK
jgi:hypothetical protein